MDFDTLNNLISIVLFSTMVATLFGTIILYGYYKARERKAKAMRSKVPGTHSMIVQIASSVRPSIGEPATETKKKIRFG